MVLGFSDVIGLVLPAREDFGEWLQQEHPELGYVESETWFAYRTYGAMLEVDHWTFLDEDWEMRIAVHVTWEPDNWEKMRLRRREAWDAEVAAFRSWDDIVSEMPLSEYPVVCGY
jgi:hypothetical protein